MAVAGALRSLRRRFTTQGPLPGAPDFVLPRWRVAMFVHGCFWHQHNGCARATKPKRNQSYWQEKFARNKERDARAVAQLVKEGWRVLTIWECETTNPRQLRARISTLLHSEMP